MSVSRVHTTFAAESVINASSLHAMKSSAEKNSTNNKYLKSDIGRLFSKMMRDGKRIYAKGDIHCKNFYLLFHSVTKVAFICQ